MYKQDNLRSGSTLLLVFSNNALSLSRKMASYFPLFTSGTPPQISFPNLGGVPIGVYVKKVRWRLFAIAFLTSLGILYVTFVIAPLCFP